MNASHTLTDRAALTRNRRRATDDALFLHRAALEEVDDRLSLVNRTFTSAAIVTGFPQVWGALHPNATLVEDTDTLALTQGAHDLVVQVMIVSAVDRLPCHDSPEDRQGGGEFSLDQLLVDFVQRLGRTLADGGAEVAHLKIFGQAGSDPAIANLTSSDGPAELSLASEIRTDAAQLVVNARVAVDPEILAQVVEAEAARLAEDYGLACDITGLQHFRPGRPVPTHRVGGSGLEDRGLRIE